MINNLDETPEGEYKEQQKVKQSKSDRANRLKELSKMSLRAKLSHINTLVADTYIIALENNELKPMELQSAISFLKNNQEVSEKPKGLSQAEEIDNLVEEL